jgi:MFS family permease
VAYGAVVVMAALNPWFLALAALLGVAGATMTVSNASANTVLQREAGPRLRGQTASLYMLAMRGGRSIGDLLTGGSVKVLGIRTALFIDGALAVLVQIWLTRASADGRTTEVSRERVS